MAQVKTITIATELSGSKPGDAHVELPYLARSPLYKEEKPYAVVYDVSDIPSAKQTNHDIELALQNIINARRFPEGTFTLERNGFEFVLNQPNSLDASNAHDQKHVYNVFRLEMKQVLHRRFPQYRSIIYVDHTVRKRSPLFPSRPGMPVDFPQPASLPHSDFTTRGSFMRMSQLYPGEPEIYQNREFDLINIWKVLAGPNNDWPLAVCDYQSVDFVTDYVANDVINERGIGENALMYCNSQHKWYYMADQEVDDLIVFRNSNSRGKRAGKTHGPSLTHIQWWLVMKTLTLCSCGFLVAFHAAFDPKTVEGPPRESIEMRFAGFY